MDRQPDSHKDKDNGETERARHSNRQTEMERKMGRVRDKERLGESEVDGREMWIEGERELKTGRQTDIRNFLKFVICIGTCNIAFD